MQKRLPCVIMRGGTSKCLFFHEDDLPKDPELRDRVLLSAMGSPDPRQIDGLGGATSTTSKVCIIAPSKVEVAQVDYTFAQVSVTQALVDYKGNCGNCSSAVGPFAVDEGLVKAEEPKTVVRIYNTNTRKVIVAEVPVREGRAQTEGDYRISGVPGTGAKILMWFESPEGSVSGALLPTGNLKDELEVPGVGWVTVSIVDASNPLVFVKASQLGLRGTESPRELDANPTFLEQIEAIRSVAAERIGLVEHWEEATSLSPAVPKAALVAPPQDYIDFYGNPVSAQEVNLVARMMSMQKTHQAYALTGSICTAVAARLPGTVVHEVAQERENSEEVRIGHASGIIALQTELEQEEEGFRVRRVGVARTARRIMEGYVYVNI